MILINMFSPNNDEDACDMLYSDEIQNQYGYSIGAFYNYFSKMNPSERHRLIKLNGNIT